MAYHKAIAHILEFLSFGTKEDSRTRKVITHPLWDLHIDHSKIKDGMEVIAEYKDGFWVCNFETRKFTNGEAPFYATNIRIKLEVIDVKEREEKWW